MDSQTVTLLDLLHLSTPMVSIYLCYLIIYLLGNECGGSNGTYAGFPLVFWPELASYPPKYDLTVCVKACPAF